nr:MAG TPA: hypothetical protein [Caudoviricetes sp.]
MGCNTEAKKQTKQTARETSRLLLCRKGGCTFENQNYEAG